MLWRRLIVCVSDDMQRCERFADFGVVTVGSQVAQELHGWLEAGRPEAKEILVADWSETLRSVLLCNVENTDLILRVGRLSHRSSDEPIFRDGSESDS